MKNNSTAFVVASLVLIICSAIAQSVAAAVLSLFIILLSCLLAKIVSKSATQYNMMVNCILVSFSTITFFTLMQWLNNCAIYNNWAVEANDQFRFWSESENSKNYTSLGQIFKDCIIYNSHYENGGYYFYLKALGYIANHLFDGNNMFYQQMGTALPGIVATVFIFGILTNYIDEDKARNYTLLFTLCTPIITHAIGIHRDELIYLFYAISIYLWLCKQFNIKVFILQVLIACIVLYLRDQHGLFAFSFVLLSVFSEQSGKRKWIYAILTLSIIAANYRSFLNIILSNLGDTNSYYGSLESEGLKNITTGIGRYVYQLPTPLKQIAQVLTVQILFPPWGKLMNAANLFGIAVGLLELVVSVYWAYVFFVAVVTVCNKRFKQYPTKLIFGFFVFFVFIVLSLSNLDLRRVICVFPLMFVFYVYSKEILLSQEEYNSIFKNFKYVYAFLCLSYFVLRIITR